MVVYNASKMCANRRVVNSDCSRKRAGDSQMILLRLEDGSQLEGFLRLCNEHPAIVEVVPISEEEFWKAPSNAI